MECTGSESVKCCQERSMREEENYRLGVKITKGIWAQRTEFINKCSEIPWK